MADLNTIMAAAPAVDATNGAAAADVAGGKTFWGLLPDGDWGPQTGTAVGSGGPYVWIPRTGQTTCYNGGTPVSCAGTGQDGEYQMGSTTIPALAPTNGLTGAYNLGWTGTTRFTDNGDGTVTDDLTGLIWLKNSDCFGARQWLQALSDANGLASGACGLSDGSAAGDWRLPNVNELHSLIDLSQSYPALPSGHPFINLNVVPDPYITPYWSSTHNIVVYQGNVIAANAWYVRPGWDGLVYNTAQNQSLFVWPVRGGQ